MAIEVGTKAPDFELKDNHGADRAALRLPGREERRAALLPLRLHRRVHRRAVRAARRAADVRRTTTSSCSPSPTTRSTPCASSPSRRAWSTRCCRDFWPHGEASRAYGVFDEDKGCAVRGTFIIDKEGVVRWTVVNGLPDARDLNEYVKALDNPVMRASGTPALACGAGTASLGSTR